MAFESMFFDSTETTPRPVTGQKWAQLNENIMTGGNGVVNIGEPLEVAPKQNMVVTLSAGGIFINGYLGNNDAPIDLELDAPPVSENRIDRIVIRFDNSPTERRIYPYVLKGNSPDVPPALTRSGDIYEMSVAQVKAVAGKSYIEETEIWDERFKEDVCGYTNLSNLLRGVVVDENGLTSLPNQSYVEVDADPSDLALADRTKTTLPISPIGIDRQEEVSSNKFIAKSSGAYYFFGYMAFDEGMLTTSSDVQILFNVNGVQQSPLIARVSATDKDNIFSGSSIQYLNAGDELDFKAYVINAPAGLTIRNHRIRIAKVS